MKQKFVINCEYDPRVQEIAEKLLEHVILKKEVITYSDLVSRLSYNTSPAGAEKMLTLISRICFDNELLPISAMVVKKNTKMPGEGFFKEFFPRQKDDNIIYSIYFELVNDIKNYKGWNKVLTAFINWDKE